VREKGYGPEQDQLKWHIVVQLMQENIQLIQLKNKKYCLNKNQMIKK